VTAYTPTPEVAAYLDGKRQRALIIGVLGLAACAAGFFMDSAQFYRSWLVAFIFWFGIALGGLAITMLNHVTGGAWGVMARRITESAAGNLPLMAVFFLPVVFGMHSLYEWTHADVVAKDPILQQKAPYLNTTFFYIRAAIYFGIWLFLLRLVRGWSLAQDREGAEPYHTRLQRVSAGGLLLYVLTLSFASTDWLMSLEPHWFSTIYGIMMLGSQGVTVFALIILTLTGLLRFKPISEIVTSVHLHDLGKLQFAFVMLWAYFNFSQYLIIWSGNLAEEVPWYVNRTQGGWQIIAVGLLFLNFIVPFAVLLSRNVKRNPGRVRPVVTLLFVMQIIYIFWLAAPAFSHGGPPHFSVHWLDLAAQLGVGGIFMWMFYSQLKSQPLLPQHEPYLEEAIHHGRHH
jgi:hypothetical protein